MANTNLTATKKAMDAVKKTLSNLSKGKDPKTRKALEDLAKHFQKIYTKQEKDLERLKKLDKEDENGAAQEIEQLRIMFISGKITQKAYEDAKDKIEKANAKRQAARNRRWAEERIQTMLAFKHAVMDAFGVDKALADEADLSVAVEMMSDYDMDDISDMVDELSKFNTKNINKEREASDKKVRSALASHKTMSATVTANMKKGFEEQVQKASASLEARKREYKQAQAEYAKISNIVSKMESDSLGEVFAREKKYNTESRFQEHLKNLKAQEANFRKNIGTGANLASIKEWKYKLDAAAAYLDKKIKDKQEELKAGKTFVRIIGKGKDKRTVTETVALSKDKQKLIEDDIRYFKELQKRVKNNDVSVLPEVRNAVDYETVLSSFPSFDKWILHANVSTEVLRAMEGGVAEAMLEDIRRGEQDHQALDPDLIAQHEEDLKKIEAFAKKRDEMLAPVQAKLEEAKKRSEDASAEHESSVAYAKRAMQQQINLESEIEQNVDKIASLNDELRELDKKSLEAQEKIADLDVKIAQAQSSNDKKLVDSLIDQLKLAKKTKQELENAVASKEKVLELAEERGSQLSKSQEVILSNAQSKFQDAQFVSSDAVSETFNAYKESRSSGQESLADARSELADQVYVPEGLKSGKDVMKGIKRKSAEKTIELIDEDDAKGRLLKGFFAMKTGFGKSGLKGAAKGLLGSVGNDIHKSISKWKDSGGLGRKVVGGLLDGGLKLGRKWLANRAYNKAVNSVDTATRALQSVPPYISQSKAFGEKAPKYLSFLVQLRDLLVRKNYEDLLNIETYGRFSTLVGGVRSMDGDDLRESALRDMAKEVEKSQIDSTTLYKDTIKRVDSIRLWLNSFGDGGEAAFNDSAAAIKSERSLFGKLQNFGTSMLGKASKAKSAATGAWSSAQKIKESSGTKGLAKHLASKGASKAWSLGKNLLFGKRNDATEAVFAKALDTEVPKLAGGGVFGAIGAALKAGKGKVAKFAGGIANRVKKGVLARFGEAGAEAVIPLQGRGAKIVAKAMGEEVAQNAGKAGGMQYESAQHMEERQKAAENQASIASNVATIVRLLEEQNKMGKQKKPESLLSKILGFLGMMATALIPKILGFLRFLWKGISFIGKLLKPVVSVLSKLMGPIMRILGGVGGKLLGVLGMIGKALAEKFGDLTKKAAEAAKDLHSPKVEKAGAEPKVKEAPKAKEAPKVEKAGAEPKVKEAPKAPKIPKGGNLFKNALKFGKGLGKGAGIGVLTEVLREGVAEGSAALLGLSQEEKETARARVEDMEYGHGKTDDIWGEYSEEEAEERRRDSEKRSRDYAFRQWARKNNVHWKTNQDSWFKFSKDFQDLTKEEVAQLSPEDRQHFERWLETSQGQEYKQEQAARTLEAELKRKREGQPAIVPIPKNADPATEARLQETRAKIAAMRQRSAAGQAAGSGVLTPTAAIVPVAKNADPATEARLQETRAKIAAMRQRRALAAALGTNVLTPAQLQTLKTPAAQQGNKTEAVKEEEKKIQEELEKNNPVGTVTGIFTSISNWFSEKYNTFNISSFLQNNNPFKCIMNGISSVFNWFNSFSLTDWIKRKFGFGDDQVPPETAFPRLGEGGLVKASKTGLLAVIAENGEDEAVLPLSKLARFILESFNLGQNTERRSSALGEEPKGGFSAFLRSMSGFGNNESEPRAGWAIDLLEEIKQIGKNIDLMTKMIKLIKVDGVTLGELVENKMLAMGGGSGRGMFGAAAGAAAQAAQAAAGGGAGGLANPASPSYGGGGGGGNPANVQPIDGGPVKIGADGIIDMDSMGSLAAKYESGGKSTLAADIGDDAGVSFGKYQIATTGTRKKFIDMMKRNGGEAAQIGAQLEAAGFINASGKNHPAAQLWKSLANAGKIQQYENQFGREFYFGTTFNNIKSEKAKEMIRNSPTLQKALYSYSLQGQNGAYVGINRDFREGMSEQDLLLLMYNDRLRRAEANKKNFIPKGKKGQPLIVGLRNRLGAEKSDSERNVALAMLKAEQQAKASGTFKNPAAPAQGQSPFTPQQQAEINANPMLQGADVKKYPSGDVGYVDIARQWAATDKGYDQNLRGAEGHFDCSSLVYRSTKAAGVKYKVPLSEFTTETMNPANKSNVMRDAGFQWVQGTEGMKSGDILWKNGHTVIYSGDGNIIGAHGIKKYKKSGKMQDLLDSVSEKRLGDKGTYAGYWRYVGGNAKIGGGVPAPQQAPIQQVQPPKPQAPIQLPMIQRGQGPTPPPMALAMPRVEAPALSGMPYIPTAQPAAPTMQPVAQPVQGMPQMGGSPIAGGGLSSVYAAMTANAMQRGVKYRLGARNSRTGLVDCSGWTIEMQKQVMQGVQDPTARARLEHVLAGGTAEGIIARGLKYQNGMSASLDPSQIKEGTMIGIKARKGGWGSNRAMGIGHIVTTFRDPNTGRMMVSESTSRGSGGRSGVITTDYEQWYKQHAGRTMWGVDTGALIGGQFDAGNVKAQMEAGGAQQTQYGMGATPQSGPQIQASQQGMVNEQASAYYAQGGGGGNIDASTNINGMPAGGGNKPSVEMVLNKDPMGWIVLQGNAVH